MKRLLTGAVALSLLLTLTACGGEAEKPSPEGSAPEQTALPTSPSKAPKPTRPPREKPVPEPMACDDSLLELAFDESGEFAFEAGTTEAFSYAVPRLLAEGPGAEALNEELEAVWLELAESSFQMLQAGEIPEIFRVDYETHWSGTLLSLVMYSASPYWEAQRQVYLYDAADDTWLDREGLAAWCGLTYEELLTAVSRGAGAWFDAHPEYYDVTGTELAQLRARALSRDALETTPVYLEDGRVKALARMPWDFSYEAQVMDVPIGTGDAVEMSVDSDWVRAELKDHQVTLTFHDVNSAMWRLSDGLELEKPYQVQGLSGTYVDMAMGILGMEYRPFLFLTDTNGRVSCCNIMGCAEVGDQFYLTAPLENVYDVVYYEYGTENLGEAGDVPTIYAHTRAGEDISLNQPAYDTSRIMPDWLQHDSWTDWEQTMNLAIGTEIGPQGCRWTYEGRSYDGWMYYLGTDQYGMQFKVSLYTDMSDGAQCRLTMPCPIYVDDVNNTVTLRPCSGPAVPGLSEWGTELNHDILW